MKKHYHDPNGKNDFVIQYTEARVDGSCKEYGYCEICSEDWHWEWI